MTRMPKKKRQIIETARRIFTQHGIRRVSVEEICQKAGVSKMTFYRYYESKIVLAEEIVRAIYEEAFAHFDILYGSEAKVEEIFEQIISYKQKLAEEFGPALLEDFLNPASPLAHFVAEMKKRGMNQFMKFLAERQARGEVRNDIRPEFILAMVNKLQELAFDKDIRALYRDQADMVREVNTFFFYGIVNGPAYAKGRKKR